MSFLTFIDGVPWPAALCAALLVITIAMALFFRPRPRLPRHRTDGEIDERGRLFDTAPEPEPELHPDLVEKRTSLRRGGSRVTVLLAEQSEKAKTFKGAVLDRSTTGLKLTVNKNIQPGCVLRVIAENAPDTTPWVHVQVARSEKVGRGTWELGCEFSQTPPWGVLLLFG